MPGLIVENPSDPTEWHYLSAGNDPAVYNTTNLGTDTRSQVCWLAGNGQLIIGGDGTNVFGFLPPAGWKIKVPNIITRGALLTAHDVDVISSPTATFNPNYSTAGSFDIEITAGYGVVYYAMQTCYKTVIKNVYSFHVILISNNFLPPLMERCGNSWRDTAGGSTGIQIDYCDDVVVNDIQTTTRLSANSYFPFRILNTKRPQVNNLRIAGISGTIGTSISTGPGIYLSDVSNGTFNNISSKRGGIRFSASSGNKFTNFDYTHSLNGEAGVGAGTAGIQIFTFSTYANDNIVDGITFGENRTYPNQAPMAGISYTANSSNNRIRNCYSASDPYIMTNSVTTSYPTLIHSDGGNCYDNKIQRIYLVPDQATNRAVIFGTSAVSSGTQIDNCWLYHTTLNPISTNGMRIRNVGYTPAWAVGGVGSVYGHDWNTAYLKHSENTGLLHLAMNEPYDFTDKVELSGTAAFSSVGFVSMPTAGDYGIWTSPIIKGYTAFANLAPEINGGSARLTNFTYEYDIDTGAGFSGTYKALTSANLILEDISDWEAGFRFRIKATCINGDGTLTTNTVTYIRVHLLTTNTAKGYLWALNTPTVELTGTETGTGLAVFRSDNEAFLGYGENGGGTVSTQVDWNADFTGVLRARKSGLQNVEISALIDEDGISIPTSQTECPFGDGSDPGELGIIVTNHGASPVTWQGKEYSNTIQVTDNNLTSFQIGTYYYYHTSQNKQWNGLYAFAWGTHLLPTGNECETARDRDFGSAGATLKGMRVVLSDGVTPHPQYTRMQADDGTYYVRTYEAMISAPNILAGSKVWLYNVSTNTEIFIGDLSNNGYQLTYTDGTHFTSGDNFILAFTKLGYVDQKIQGQVTSDGAIILNTQIVDEIYNSYGIDGSTVMKFEADYSNQNVKVIVHDNFTVKELYAWYMYMLTLVDGIRYFVGAVTALDEGNIRINSNIANVKIDNDTIHNIFQDDNVRLFRSDGEYPILNPTSGGGGIDIVWRVPVVIANSEGLATKKDVIIASQL
jgi:hypothetical protein